MVRSFKVLVHCAILLAGCGQSEDRDAALIAKAKGHIELGELSLAEVTLDKALNQNPKLVDGYVWRSHVFLMRGWLEAAILDCDTAISLDSTCVAAWHNRASARVRQGEYEAACEDFSHAIRLDASYVLSLIGRAKLRAAHGEIQLAINDYTRALELDPDSAQLRSLRGNCSGALDEFDAAESDLTEAIRLEPGAWDLFLYRGHWRSRNGRNVEAMSDFRKSIQCDPRQHLPYRAMANLLFKPNAEEKDNAQALEYAERAVELSEWSNSNHLEFLARIHYQQRNPSSAARFLLKAIDVNSDGFDRDKAREKLKEYERAARDPKF